MKLFLKPNKKGFTMVEVIVVVAIIGVLGAITVPWFMNSQNPAKEANEKARSFYFALQNEVTELRLNGLRTLEFGSDGFLIAVSLNSDGSVYNYVEHNAGISNTVYNDTAVLIKNMTTVKLDKFLMNYSDSGYFCAYIDEKCRVQWACWTGTAGVVSDLYSHWSVIDAPNTWVKNHNYLDNSYSNGGTFLGIFPYQ